MRYWDAKLGRLVVVKLRRKIHAPQVPLMATFSCFHGLRLLGADRTRRWMVEEINRARRETRVHLWAGVLMPDHVHLLPWDPHDDRVEEFLSKIKSRVGARAIGWLRQRRPEWLRKLRVVEGRRVRHRFWQPGGGHRKLLETWDDIEHELDYIHMNPVRAGLVERPELWPWSTAPWYAGVSPRHLPVDDSLRWAV